MIRFHIRTDEERKKHEKKLKRIDYTMKTIKVLMIIVSAYPEFWIYLDFISKKRFHVQI